MKRIATTVAILLAMPAAAIAATVALNSQGAGGAPVSVGSSSVVQVIPAANDLSWTIELESADARCAFGDTLGNPANPAPSATSGFLIPYIKGQVWKESGQNAMRRFDCIGVSATGNIDTDEERP